MDLSVLNTNQKEAVITTEGPVMVMAGAGSGKTRVLTYRIAYLISELGINPTNILAVTFTNKAAREMKERVEKMLNMNVNHLWISTFHSFCARFLRREIRWLNLYKNDFVIIDEDDAIKILKEEMKDKEFMLTPKEAMSFISLAKNHEPLPDMETNERKEFETIYSLYQNHFFLNRSNTICPIFLSIPCFVKGIPVCFAICCFTFVIPNALFQEKETPGIFSFVMILE